MDICLAAMTADQLVVLMAVQSAALLAAYWAVRLVGHLVVLMAVRWVEMSAVQ